MLLLTVVKVEAPGGERLGGFIVSRRINLHVINSLQIPLEKLLFNIKCLGNIG